MVRLAGILFLAGVLSACGAPQENPADRASSDSLNTEAMVFRNIANETAYVGDEACFSCHEDLWRGYQSHGMAQSYYPMTPEHVVEDFDAPPVHHEASNFTYRVFERGGEYFQEEYRQDARGQKIHSLVRRMDFVVGSGTAARTYLTENNGRLYELPLTWYTQVEKWDFSPGYRERNGRFDRLIPDGCMACHNSYPETVSFVSGKYTEVPNGIGCERCHGPGELHVEERLADPEPPGDIDETIVNPKHLSLDLALDVCQQCHLHGTVSVERAGRTPFDYRPSQPLSAHEALFSVDAQDDAGQISVISHADRMKKSACFLETRASDAPMTCVTCHDPHQGFREKGPAYFNETCQDCHAPAALQARFGTEALQQTHAASANCIACHMPKTDAEDAPHSSFTDHWIRVVEEEVAPPAPLAAHESLDLVAYFDRDEQGAEGALYKGMAYVIIGEQQGSQALLRKGVALLEDGLAQQPDVAKAQKMLGIGYARLGDVKQAIGAFEEAVRLAPDEPEHLYGLANVYELEGRDPAVIERLYQRALAIQPAQAQTRINYGRFLETQGRLDEAIVQYQQAIEEQPWLDVGYYNLGTAYLQKQMFDEAEAALLEALRLQPDDPLTLDNLGLLYINQGQKEQALAYFEQAVEVAPQDPAALGNLGTFYVNEGAYQQAVDLLTRAVEINPSYINGFVNLSLAHFRLENMAQARRYAQQALQLDPGNDKARQLFEASQ